MGMNDVNRISKPRVANEARPELPPLFKAIKSLKDKCYAVARYAYLKEWDYYVVETNDFKLSVKKNTDPEFYKFLDMAGLKKRSILICVEGLEFYSVCTASECIWGSSESDKSIQYWVEGDLQDTPIPNKNDIIDEIPF